MEIIARPRDVAEIVLSSFKYLEFDIDAIGTMAGNGVRNYLCVAIALCIIVSNNLLLVFLKLIAQEFRSRQEIQLDIVVDEFLICAQLNFRLLSPGPAYSLWGY